MSNRDCRETAAHMQQRARLDLGLAFPARKSPAFGFLIPALLVRGNAKPGWIWRSGNAKGMPKPRERQSPQPSWFAIQTGHALDDPDSGCYGSFTGPHLPRHCTARIRSHLDLYELVTAEQGCDRRGTRLGLANPSE